MEKVDWESPFFDCRSGRGRKRFTSAVTFGADLRFTKMMIVREQNGLESVATPLSNAQGMSNLLGCMKKTVVDCFKIWRLTTL